MPSFTTVSLKFQALIYGKNSAIMRLIVRSVSTFMVGSGPDLFQGGGGYWGSSAFVLVHVPIDCGVNGVALGLNSEAICLLHVELRINKIFTFWSD